ncbi:hypothetical protein D3C80_1924690 [compost metagenome]
MNAREIAPSFARDKDSRHRAFEVGVVADRDVERFLDPHHKGESSQRFLNLDEVGLSDRDHFRLAESLVHDLIDIAQIEFPRNLCAHSKGQRFESIRVAKYTVRW